MKHKFAQKFDLIFFIAVLLMILFLVWSTRAQEAAVSEKQTPENFASVAAAGTLALEKNVTAGGGNQMAQSSFRLAGTTGEPIAGRQSSGGNFTLYSGFWTPESFAPTAANVTVGGRVKTADGRGIRSALVTITFPSGERRTVASGTRGYYRFAEIPAGDTYIFSVSAKRYSFSQPTQIVNVTEDVQDIDFTADAEAGNTVETP